MNKKIINTPKLLYFNWLKKQNLKGIEEGSETSEATKVPKDEWEYFF